jgi:hypothetical protein
VSNGTTVTNAGDGAYYGCGGGGGAWGSGTSVANAGSGAQGVVVIRYLGSQVATGGTVSSSGGYTYHTFTSNGTFAF